MKRVLYLLLCCCIALLGLTACGREDDSTAASYTDFNQYLNSQSIYGCTDNGWYIWSHDQVYFQDADVTSGPVVLCAKANCGHNAPNTCTSYLTAGSYGIFAWNNTLYYLCMPLGHDGIDLCQMGLDGQGRKVIANLFPGANNYSFMADVGGGYLTVALSEYTVNGDVTTLYLISLADPTAEPAVLFTNEEQVVAAQGDTSQIPQPYVMHVGEEWVFYNVESGTTGQRSNSLYGYEIATGETKLLVEDTFFIGGDLSPVGDVLYWYDTDGSTYGRLTQINLKSGETALVRDIPIGDDVWGDIDLSLIHI